MTISEKLVLPAQWHWVQYLDGPKNRAATGELLSRHQYRAALGDGPVRWAAAVGDRIAEAIRDHIPNWPADHSEGELNALRRSSAASVLDALIAMITADSSVLTRASEPRVSIGYYIRRGLSLDDVLRTVPAGRAYFRAELSDAIDTYAQPAERAQARQVIDGHFEAFGAAYERFLTEAWGAERERWTLGDLGRRYRLVKSVLEGSHAVASGEDLGYPMNGHHVSAIVPFGGNGAGRNLLARVHQLAADSGSTGTPLVLPRGPARIDVWFPSPRRDPAQLAASADWPAEVTLAFGEPGDGVEGFRSSFRQAEAADRVARLRGSSARVTRYAEVEQLAVLTAAPDLAVALARRNLGPLAGTDVRLARLRETLAAYLANGMSINDTANALQIHRNTIGYRLRQIEKLIPSSYERTELRAALLLAAELPQLVLTSDASESAKTPPNGPPAERVG